VRAQFADEIEGVGHGHEEFNVFSGIPKTADNFVRWMREVVATAPDTRIRATAMHGIGSRAACYTLTVAGSTPDVAVIERAWFCVHEVHDGLITSLGFFEEDQLEAALARFEELEGFTSDIAGWDTVATRASRALTDAMNRRDVDAITGRLADDVVWEDRRKGLVHITRGKA
jgi:hypothetical protein